MANRDDRRSGANQGRRANFRVDDDAFLEYTPIPGPGEDAAWRLAQHREWPSAFALCSRLFEIHQETTVLRRYAQRESLTFARLVDHVNRKLDLVTEVLVAHELREREPIAVSVDVGADGLGFRAPESLKVDTVLDVRVLFRSTGLGLRTAATVVRCEPEGEGRYGVGLVFHYAREQDRELMVHHVLQRQSMLLRRDGEEP